MEPLDPNKKLRNYSYFEEAMSKLDLTAGELCAACGYGKSSYCDWKKKGKIPTPLALACECLLRRQKKEADLPAALNMYVLLVPRDDKRQFVAMCNKVFNADIITCFPVAPK